MNDMSGLTLIGAGAIAAGLVALAGLVRFDLGPAARLRRGGQIALACGLGLGIAAFSVKFAAIQLVARLPERALARQAAAADPAMSQSNAAPPDRADAPVAWRALPEVAPYPPDNPVTPAKAALGERLFHDPALSADRRIACASCHDVRQGAGADRRALSLGVDGAVGLRNAPSVYNAAFQSVLFWDGRARTLEEQAAGPLTNPLEMGMPDMAAVAARVSEQPAYATLFAAAFGPDAPIDGARILAALATYERTLVTADTPYDRFVRGERDALSRSQLRGMALFQSVGCAQCHAGSNFSGAALGERNGAFRLFPARAHPRAERAGFAFAPEQGEARRVWRIPSLRNVALTGPYFHNGAVADLAEAVRIMAAVQCDATLDDDADDRTTIDWRPETGLLTSVRPQRVSERDIADLVAFLGALSSDRLTARTPRAGDSR